MSRRFLLKTGAISEIQVAVTGIDSKTTEFVNEHSPI